MHGLCWNVGESRACLSQKWDSLPWLAINPPSRWCGLAANSRWNIVAPLGLFARKWGPTFELPSCPGRWELMHRLCWNVSSLRRCLWPKFEILYNLTNHQTPPDDGLSWTDFSLDPCQFPAVCPNSRLTQPLPARKRRPSGQNRSFLAPFLRS